MSALEIEVRRTEKVAVKYLQVEAGVRYWEDATVDGVADDDGSLIPCRSGGLWSPLIDLETGTIKDWPEGKTASVHYKVCDSGRYILLNADGIEVSAIDGYVPKIMCPGDNGYGDYIIMSIDGGGKIAKWRPDLSAFSGDEE